MLEEEGLARVVCKRLNLNVPAPTSPNGPGMVERAKSTVDGQVEVALVGKYVELHDSYLSVVEALTHGRLRTR